MSEIYKSMLPGEDGGSFLVELPFDLQNLDYFSNEYGDAASGAYAYVTQPYGGDASHNDSGSLDLFYSLDFAIPGFSSDNPVTLGHGLGGAELIDSYEETQDGASVVYTGDTTYPNWIGNFLTVKDADEQLYVTLMHLQNNGVDEQGLTGVVGLTGYREGYHVHINYGSDLFGPMTVRDAPDGQTDKGATVADSSEQESTPIQFQTALGSIFEGLVTEQSFDASGIVNIKPSGTPVDDNIYLIGDSPADISGNASDNILSGNEAANRIQGLAGDDNIWGGDGDDTIFGEQDAPITAGGEDVVYAGFGDDYVNGGGGDDWIFGDSGESWLEANLTPREKEFLQGLDFDNNPVLGETSSDQPGTEIRFDFRYGRTDISDGDDDLRGDAGSDVIFGGEGNDTIYGGGRDSYDPLQEENDVIFGGKGDDHLYGELGDDIIFGGDGEDVAYFAEREGANHGFHMVRDADGALVVTQIATSSDAPDPLPDGSARLYDVEWVDFGGTRIHTSRISDDGAVIQSSDDLNEQDLLNEQGEGGIWEWLQGVREFFIGTPVFGFEGDVEDYVFDYSGGFLTAIRTTVGGEQIHPQSYSLMGSVQHVSFNNTGLVALAELPDIVSGTADGPIQSQSGALLDESDDTIGVVSIEAPIFMGDGDADYTVSLAGVGRGLQYNIAYIIDVSGSMGGARISDAKNAYIELTNQLVALGIADVANFAVIPFNSSSTLYADLVAQEAIDRVASLSAGGGTSFGPALANAETFFSSANTGQTNIAYFLSDGQGSGASDLLTNIANVQAFGIGSGANLSALNIIDSDNAVSLSSSAQLVNVLTGSSVDVSEIDRIEITLAGQIVETITPDQLVNGPLGLQYTGTLSGLDVSASAQNLVNATVYLTNGALSGEVELSIASALNDTSVVSNGTITNVIFGALSTFFDADASGAQNVSLLGNNLDNNIVATNIGGTFSTFGGDDIFFLGDYANSTVDRVIDGGEGYDVIEYVGNYIQSLVNKIGNVIKVGSNTDTITNVEEIRFSDAVLDTANFTITYLNTPPIAINDAFIVGEDQMLVGNVLDDNGSGPDSDPDGDAMSVSLVDGPTEGALTLNADGSFSYDADSDVFDLASPDDVIDQSFTYQVEDGNGGVAQATATISVTILDDGEMVYGGNGRQTLTGTDGGEDQLFGENGQDELFGLDGADFLDGGRGDDFIFGGEGPDVLFGGQGDDSLDGGQGNDSLNGGKGNDVLRGGLGDDELTGDKGDDIFVFTAGEGTDTVTDFGVGEDLIAFEGLAFDDVTIGQLGADATISSDGEILAVLVGVESSTLDGLDFVFNS